MRLENWKVFLWCSYKPWMCNEHQGNLWIRWWHLWYSKEKVEICWFFWFKYKCRITQHIIQTILLVGSGLGMNTTEKWKAISVSGTIHKIFCSTLTIVQSKQKNNLKQFFFKLNLHIFLLEICLKMKNQRKNTTGSVSNAVYADGLCQHCFDFRNYFFCF